MSKLWNLRVRTIQYPLQKQKQDPFIKNNWNFTYSSPSLVFPGLHVAKQSKIANKPITYLTMK